jgi:hypothetical protein
MTGTKAIAIALSPDYESHESSPGSGMSVTFSRGYITGDEVRQLHALWDDAMRALTTASAKDIRPLIAAVHSLVYPYVMNVSLTPAHRGDMRKLANQMLRDIARLASDRPGVLAWVGKMSAEAGEPLLLDVPEDYLVISPIREHKDWRVAAEEEQAKARALAQQWAIADAASTAARIVYLEREAAAADIEHPRGTFQLCVELAALVSRPVVWLEALMYAGARPDLLIPFVSRIVQAPDQGLERVLAKCLATRPFHSIGIEAILMMSDPPQSLLEEAMRQLPSVSNAIDVWCIRDQVAKEHIPRLLTHPDATVAVRAATGLFHTHKPIDESIKQLWRDAIVRCGSSQPSFHGVFDNDPELAFEWLAKRIEEQSNELWRDEHNVQWALDVLRAEHRLKLIDLLPDRRILHEFVVQLVKDDPTAYRRLLARKDLHWLHFAMLEGKPGPGWIDKLIAALDAGYPAQEIADEVATQGRSWSGSEAAMWQEWIDALQPVLAKSDHRVQEVARRMVDYYATRRDVAKQRERREAVFGRY